MANVKDDDAETLDFADESEYIDEYIDTRDEVLYPEWMERDPST